MQLITDDYLELNKKLHQENKEYGANGAKWSKHLINIIQIAKIKTILDYGCGKGSLYFQLRNAVEDYQNYDPCIDEFSAEPRPAQLVICTDVMEHVEPELTDNILTDIRNKSQGMVFFNIALKPAAKTLPDGRNTHINLHPINWWIRKLINYFELMEVGLVNQTDSEGNVKAYESFCFTGKLML